MPKVIHFEIPADDPKRAIEFYQSAFGWEINKWGPQDYWLISAGPESESGINGALMPKEETQDCTRNTISVPSFDEYTAKVAASGGAVITPKMSVPGIGYMAYCKDTEGNIFGIMETDETAK